MSTRRTYLRAALRIRVQKQQRHAVLPAADVEMHLAFLGVHVSATNDAFLHGRLLRASLQRAGARGSMKTSLDFTCLKFLRLLPTEARASLGVSPLEVQNFKSPPGNLKVFVPVVNWRGLQYPVR